LFYAWQIYGFCLNGNRLVLAQIAMETLQDKIILFSGPKERLKEAPFGLLKTNCFDQKL
jgi:hypothetical protein